jgi:hypothetical protein
MRGGEWTAFLLVAFWVAVGFAAHAQRRRKRK